MKPTYPKKLHQQWRNVLHEVIFEADTTAGKLFDVVLIISILCSVAAVMLESIASIRQRNETLLHAIEWFFTIFFSVEYILRIICVGKPLRYIYSSRSGFRISQE